MRFLLLLIGWLILLAVSWPVALAVLVLAPVLLVLALPFMLVAAVVCAAWALLKALLFLPARILGYRG